MMTIFDHFILSWLFYEQENIFEIMMNKDTQHISVLNEQGSVLELTLD